MGKGMVRGPILGAPENLIDFGATLRKINKPLRIQTPPDRIGLRVSIPSEMHPFQKKTSLKMVENDRWHKSTKWGYYPRSSTAKALKK